jgi:hypothetical protein
VKSGNQSFNKLIVASKIGKTELMTGATISESYRELQKQLHENPHYGEASLVFAEVVKRIFEKIKAKSISDYGAGKCNLKLGLERNGLTDFDYYPYDPAFPEYGPPRAADLTCCIDVLEHIEPEYLENVLQDLQKITVRFGFFTIATGPAMKILTDGRNAHLIQQPSSWWLERLEKSFVIEQVHGESDYNFLVLVRSKSATSSSKPT